MAITMSWGSEIPKIVKNIRDGLISLFAGLIPFQEVMAGWWGTDTATFTTVCGVGILVTGVIAKMFGVNDSVIVTPSADKEITELKAVEKPKTD